MSQRGGKEFELQVWLSKNKEQMFVKTLLAVGPPPRHAERKSNGRPSYYLFAPTIEWRKEALDCLMKLIPADLKRVAGCHIEPTSMWDLPVTRLRDEFMKWCMRNYDG